MLACNGTHLYEARSRPLEGTYCKDVQKLLLPSSEKVVTSPKVPGSTHLRVP
jgi:hypothetical protein